MLKVIIISTDENGRKKVVTRVRTCQEFEGEDDGEDRISNLPDEIIVKILSLLPIREVMCTSVLSHRWRHVWTHTQNLNFDATKIIYELELGSRGRDHYIETQKYINMVDHVLNSHQAPYIDLLRIQFHLRTRQYDHYIDKLIGFSIKRKVKRLEIDLSRKRLDDQIYSHLLRHSGFVYLEEIRLVFLDVAGEWLESILGSCPKLEFVSISGSKRLVDLSVAGLSLQLKYLKISNCPQLKKIEIFAENLRTLKYSGRIIKLSALNNNNPRLTKLYFGGAHGKAFVHNIPHFSNKFSQIEALGLDMFRIQKILDFRHFPKLCNLKQLDLKLQAKSDESLLGLIGLLKVSPFLQKFILRLKCFQERSRDRKVKEAESFRHNHLKVVEFHGFFGLAIDVELVTYFFQNAVSLEKIIINCEEISFPESVWNLREDKGKINARKQAILLAEKLLPRGVTMQIN